MTDETEHESGVPLGKVELRYTVRSPCENHGEHTLTIDASWDEEGKQPTVIRIRDDLGNTWKGGSTIDSPLMHAQGTLPPHLVVVALRFMFNDLTQANLRWISMMASTEMLAHQTRDERAGLERADKAKEDLH